MKKIKPNFKELNKHAIEGTLPDDLNPLFIFSFTDNQLLCDIANGKIDCVSLAKRTLKDNQLLCDIVNGKIDCVSFAKRTLKDRGYNEKNEFVGFNFN